MEPPAETKTTGTGASLDTWTLWCPRDAQVETSRGQWGEVGAGGMDLEVMGREEMGHSVKTQRRKGWRGAEIRKGL